MNITMNKMQVKNIINTTQTVYMLATYKMKIYELAVIQVINENDYVSHKKHYFKFVIQSLQNNINT